MNKICNFTKDDNSKYENINELFKKLFEYVKTHNIFEMECGKYEVDSNKLFFTISDCNLKDKANAFLESHKKYADLQVIFKGNETFGLSNVADCKEIKKEYNPEKDVMFFADTPKEFLNLKDGNYIVFMPEDAHAPLIGNGTVRKCVFKILL